MSGHAMAMYGSVTTLQCSGDTVSGHCASVTVDGNLQPKLITRGGKIGPARGRVAARPARNNASEASLQGI